MAVSSSHLAKELTRAFRESDMATLDVPGLGESLMATRNTEHQKQMQLYQQRLAQNNMKLNQQQIELQQQQAQMAANHTHYANHIHYGNLAALQGQGAVIKNPYLQPYLETMLNFSIPEGHEVFYDPDTGIIATRPKILAYPTEHINFIEKRLAERDSKLN